MFSQIDLFDVGNKVAFYSRFWKMLRIEAAPPNKDAKGNPFTMHQLRFLFNGARIPGEGSGGDGQGHQLFQNR